MMKKISLIFLSTFFIFISACQTISPIFVNYNGVRRDVAQWINHHTFLSMQQKRSLVRLAKVQQQLTHQDRLKTEAEKFTYAKEYAIAMHCARTSVSRKKIQQLQDQIFTYNDQERLFQAFEQNFPKIKLDHTQIDCKN